MQNEENERLYSFIRDNDIRYVTSPEWQSLTHWEQNQRLADEFHNLNLNHLPIPEQQSINEGRRELRESDFFNLSSEERSERVSEALDNTLNSRNWSARVTRTRNGFRPNFGEDIFIDTDFENRNQIINSLRTTSSSSNFTNFLDKFNSKTSFCFGKLNALTISEYNKKYNSKKQLKAKKRNWFKFRLLGLNSVLHDTRSRRNDYLTKSEKETLQYAKDLIQHVLGNWEKSNTELNLKTNKLKI